MPDRAPVDKPALVLAVAGFVLVNVAVLIHLLSDSGRLVVTGVLVVGAILAAIAYFRIRKAD